MLEKIDFSSHLNILSEPVKTEFHAFDLETAKVHVKTLLDDDPSTMKQFMVDDALDGIDILLLALDLPLAKRCALHTLRYKVNDLTKTYWACSIDQAKKKPKMAKCKSIDKAYKAQVAKNDKIAVELTQTSDEDDAK